jgi:hypothetical protein
MLANGQPISDQNLEMPNFYLRNNSFMATFRIITQGSEDSIGKIEASIKPSLNLERKIKERVIDYVVDTIQDSEELAGQGGPN